MNNWLEILYQIFELCVIPLLAILTKALINYIDKRSSAIAAQEENEIKAKYEEKIAETIKICVQTTNQTYVNSLKTKGDFGIEAQREAFKKSYDAVMVILNQELKDYLSEAYSDVNLYITQKIEAEVALNKK